MDGSTTSFVTSGWPMPIVLAFNNGRLSHGHVLGAYVNAGDDCWVDADDIGGNTRRVRTKFDDTIPKTVAWTISADHHALAPPDQARFAKALLHHDSFMIHFGCDRNDPGETLTYVISGLDVFLSQHRLSVDTQLTQRK